MRARHGLLLMLVVAGVVVALSTASSEPIGSRSGWAPEDRARFGLEKARTRECTKTTSRYELSDRLIEENVSERLRPALDPKWAETWIDTCDDGRFKVGIVEGSTRDVRRRVDAARRVLRRTSVARYTDLVAVRSTTRRIMQEQDRLVDRDPIRTLLQAGLLEIGRQPSRNAVVIRLARRVSENDARVVRRLARAAGVNVFVDRVDADSLEAEPG